MIEVKNITKTYGKKTNVFVALRDISFQIPDGASVAILGKSGSGKSTLMHCISGLDRPEKGQIIIDGQNILKMNKKEIDKFRLNMISFIFQSFFVQANETCFDNVSLPPEIADVPYLKRKSKVESALKAVELFDKKNSKAHDLSGGQKQRLAVARAIVGSPKIIFADEPTGNLDSITGKVVEDLLFGYHDKHKTTLVIVTHDDDLAKRCDMQIRLVDGMITEIGDNNASI